VKEAIKYVKKEIKDFNNLKRLKDKDLNKLLMLGGVKCNVE
jgi:hypothetical protein